MKSIANITNLDELEQARRALSHAELPTNEKASRAEKLGDYRMARQLWLQVVAHSEKDSIMQTYAHRRQKFCMSAVMHNYKRPELRQIGA